MMYGSLRKRMKKKVQYSLAYDESKPLGDNWYQDTSNNVKKNIENENKIKQDENPVNQNILPSVVSDNSVTNDPKALYPRVKDENIVKNKDNDKNKGQNIINYSQDEYTPVTKKEYTQNKDGKKTNFSTNRLFLFFLVIIALYCLYKYSSNFKGKSFFGARECVSYDISNAYDMVK